MGELALVPQYDDDDDRLDGDDLGRKTKRAGVLIGGLFAALVLIASLLNINGAVVGGGKLAVASKVKTITHATGGILAELLVRDGEHVKAGQLLMRFDEAVSTSSMETTQLNRDQLMARKARLEAERDGAGGVIFPAELIHATNPSKAIAMQQEGALFQLRRRERASNVALLNERIQQSNQQIASYDAQIDAAQRQLALIKPELDGLRKMYREGYVTINRLNTMERTSVQLDSQIAALSANVAEARAQISEIREQILGVRESARADAGTELAQVNADLNEQTTRLVSATDTQTRSQIVAPQSGVVDNIAFTTTGSAIPPTTPIMEIVPDSDSLIVTTQVRPADVDNLEIGQRAVIRFSSLNREHSPEVEGKVTFISADRTEDRQTGAAYYRAEVEVDPKSDTKGLLKQLRPGTPAEVFFQTGSRSILSYLFKPLVDQLEFSMRQ